MILFFTSSPAHYAAVALAPYAVLTGTRSNTDMARPPTVRKGLRLDYQDTTPELITNILGVWREGVTEAASKLQGAGLIHYSSGRITVLDVLARASAMTLSGGSTYADHARLFFMVNRVAMIETENELHIHGMFVLGYQAYSGGALLPLYPAKGLAYPRELTHLETSRAILSARPSWRTTSIQLRWATGSH